MTGRGFNQTAAAGQKQLVRDIEALAIAIANNLQPAEMLRRIAMISRKAHVDGALVADLVADVFDDVCEIRVRLQILLEVP